MTATAGAGVRGVAPIVVTSEARTQCSPLDHGVNRSSDATRGGVMKQKIHVMVSLMAVAISMLRASGCPRSAGAILTSWTGQASRARPWSR